MELLEAADTFVVVVAYYWYCIDIDIITWHLRGLCRKNLQAEPSANSSPWSNIIAFQKKNCFHILALSIITWHWQVLLCSVKGQGLRLLGKQLAILSSNPKPWDLTMLQEVAKGGKSEVKKTFSISGYNSGIPGQHSRQPAHSSSQCIQFPPAEQPLPPRKKDAIQMLQGIWEAHHGNLFLMWLKALLKLKLKQQLNGVAI